MGEALTSCLYDCEVMHHRLSPKKHKFRYRMFYLDVDLEELPELSRKLWLFGYNKRNFYSFRDSDHLDLGVDGGLRGSIAAWLKENGIELRSDDRIRLVTLPRVLGYIFNPVCFYFVMRDDEAIHVLVEVCNTFREVKPYLIETPKAPGRFELTAPKHFYVSPFTSLTAQFNFRVNVPNDKLEIHIDDQEEGKTILVSCLRGERKPLTDRRLLWYALRFPLLTAQVMIKIHWQALKLWLKRLPYFRKRADPDLQRDLYRPHSTLTQSKK